MEDCDVGVFDGKKDVTEEGKSGRLVGNWRFGGGGIEELGNQGNYCRVILISMWVIILDL